MVTNIKEYWDFVVIQNKEAFEEKVSEQSAWNYSVSLFHVIDWLSTGCDTRKKTVVSKLKEECPDIELLKDICDTRKHFSLRNKERAVAEADQVKVSAGYGVGDYGVETYGMPYGVINTKTGKRMLSTCYVNVTTF